MILLRKLKSSDYLSIISLLIAIISLWQTYNLNTPVISVKDAPIFSFGDSKDGNDSYLHWLRLQFTNRGGGPVTLIKLTKPEKSSPLQAILSDGRLVNADKGLDLLYRDDTVIDKYDFLNADETSRRIYPTDEIILNKLINPGEVIYVDLCVKVRNAYTTTMETILLEYEAEFSDGQQLPLRVSFDAKLKRFGR